VWDTRSKTRETTYVPGLDVRFLSLLIHIRTNFAIVRDFDVAARVLMKSSNASAGTLFSRASASQAVHVQSSTDIGRARWDSVHRLKLEAWDLLDKGTSSMSTAIDEVEGELEEVSIGLPKSGGEMRDPGPSRLWQAHLQLMKV
jgi:hypothetical protein